MKDLEKQFDTMGVKEKDEDKDDSDIDIKVDELLQDLTINDKEEKDKNIKESEDIKAVNIEPKEEENIANQKLIGKRDRKGENIN